MSVPAGRQARWICPYISIFLMSLMGFFKVELRPVSVRSTKGIIISSPSGQRFSTTDSYPSSREWPQSPHVWQQKYCLHRAHRVSPRQFRHIPSFEEYGFSLADQKAEGL